MDKLMKELKESFKDEGLHSLDIADYTIINAIMLWEIRKELSEIRDILTSIDFEYTKRGRP